MEKTTGLTAGLGALTTGGADLPQRPVAIVCDSSCTLSRTRAEELGVTVVPMHYNVDGLRYAETFRNENGDYDSLFRNGRLLMTEAVYQDEFADEFRRLLDADFSVLCLTISSRLSGTYRSAVHAREQLIREGEAPERMRIIDSWTTSGGLEFLVRQARKLVSLGYGLETVGEKLEAERARQGIYFTVPDLEVLRKSGRLGATRRAVPSNLDRFLVMELQEGGIKDVCVAHGMRGTARALIAEIPEEARKNSVTVTGYGEAHEAVEELVHEVRRELPETTIHVRDGGPVVSLHLGVGSVSLAWRNFAE